MKEFVEKLIERLEKELHLADKDKREANVLQFDRAVGYANGLANAIEIVNQLAEEYNPSKSKSLEKQPEEPQTNFYAERFNRVI